MPRNEEGEFELVLGNRQLLSVFFVAVILMGVCFAAGYIFGRNSAAPGGETAIAKKGDERSIVIDPTTSAAKGAGARSSLAPGQAEVRGVSPAPPAASPAAKPAPTAERAAAPPREAPKPAGEAARSAPPEPKPAARTVGGIAQPAPGQIYLQVAAVKRQDADTLVGELRKKEFSALVGAGPNESLFRVLVGPLGDSGEVARQRTRLKDLGFDPIVKRY